MKADLHIHSNVSDCSDSIADIIILAKKRKLDAIAITDHDTMSHLEKLPLDPDIRIIGGIEISAIHSKTKTRTHILGYNIKKPEIVSSLTKPILEARNENSEKQVRFLRQFGCLIDSKKLARADGKYLYKQHIMDWLVTTGQVPDMFGDFYQKAFKAGGLCAFDIKYVGVCEAIRAIKEAGGLAVLAHPGQQQNFRIIPELVKIGLDGLELNHHSHSEKDRDTIRNYAERFNLFLTGGSDYHGRYEPNAYKIGDYLSDESGINAIINDSAL